MSNGLYFSCSLSDESSSWGPPRLSSVGYTCKVAGRKLTTHLHLFLRVRMYGATPPSLISSWHDA
jgi:hypothetical protein